MCAKVISISCTCWATYNNQKTTPGQEVHKFYPFQALCLAYWVFQKYQTKVANFVPRMGGPTAECFQRQGASPPPPEPVTMGSAPEPRWGLCPQNPVIGSRSALAMESYSRLLSTPLFSMATPLPKTVIGEGHFLTGGRNSNQFAVVSLVSFFVCRWLVAIQKYI